MKGCKFSPGENVLVFKRQKDVWNVLTKKVKKTYFSETTLFGVKHNYIFCDIVEPSLTSKGFKQIQSITINIR